MSAADSKKISYLARNFDDYRKELRNFTEKYYPNMTDTYDDASVGQWFLDMFASVADDLSYHIDRSYQETNINSAQMTSSIYNMARNAGLKVPGRKCAMCECEFSCEVPVNGAYNEEASIQKPDINYAPIIKRGTLVSNGTSKFEVMEDINFAEQFDENGVSNRQIIPKKNANGQVEKYILKKLSVVVAGESKIYRKTIAESDIEPFMEVTLQDTNVCNVESIIVKDGTNFKVDPNINDFFIEDEFVQANTSNGVSTDTYRFFEVESLADQYRFGDELNSDGVPQGEEVEWTEADGTVVTTPFIYKGEWKPVKQKFITEFTDNGQLKITFGSGYGTPTLDGYEAQGYSTLWQISHLINNDNLGVLPKPNQTMFVLYRVGGGAESNVAKGAITNIIYSNVEISGDGSCSNYDLQTIAQVKNSIKVTNTSASIGGKDAPSVEEIKYMIKYNAFAQDRCVTIKDYYPRIMKIPPKYGCPFRVSTVEENNKVCIYTLYTDFQGHLTNALPNILVENLENYLSEYRMINDFVEIRSGRVINISFEIDLFVNKSYNKADVVKSVIDLVLDYMDINKHQMGEDIFVGDIIKEITQLDGVISLIELRAYNEYGTKYSQDQTSQDRVTMTSCNYGETEDPADTSERFQIDLINNDNVLYADVDAMLEVKYDNDVKVRIKQM